MDTYKAGKIKKNNIYKLNEESSLVEDNLYSHCFFAFSPRSRTLIKLSRKLFFELKNSLNLNIRKFSPQIIKTLNDHLIICPMRKVVKENYNYTPTQAVFFPTNNCNLRCVYCYADAGEKEINKDMTNKIAKCAIDFIINNAIKTSGKISLKFHGGGEPFLKFKLIRNIVNYARKKVSDQNLLIKKMSGSTNGVLTDEKRRWIINNFNDIQVSIDGLEDIQNFQRPASSRKINTFQEVVKTIKFFDKNNFNYKIKTTLTSASVTGLYSFVKFIHESTKCKKIHFETINLFGRGLNNVVTTPEIDKLYNNWLKAQIYAYKNGIELYSSEFNINYKKSDFCGANRDNFLINPDGSVTMCYKVGNINHSLARVFMIGRYSKKENKFVFKKGAIKKLRKLNYRPQNCINCPAFNICNNRCLANYLLFDNLNRNKKDKLACSFRIAAVKKQLSEFYKNNNLRKILGITLIKLQ